MVALLIILSLGCICVQQASGQDEGPRKKQTRIHGQVVNAVTQEPIGRALVYSPDNRFATLTDGEGHFEFVTPGVAPDGTSGTVGTFFAGGARGQIWSGLAPGGPVFLRARKPGFLDGPDLGGQIQPSAEGELRIALMPEALIYGRVNLSSSDAAVGMEVQVFSRQVQDGILRWMPAASVRTNSKGEFRFAELPPGAYKLFTHELLDDDPVSTVPGGQLYGYPPVYYPGATNFAAGGTIQLSAGQAFQVDLSPIRQPYYPVTIPVLDADLNAGLNITVLVQGHPGPGYSLGFNGEKQTIGGLLPTGTYLVEASTYGPNPATGVVGLAVAGGPAVGPKMVLTRNGTLNFNVTEEFTSTNWTGSSTWSDGKRTFSVRGPRLYLQVEAQPADDFAAPSNAFLRPPTGPEDDSLVLQNLAPGRYWLRLQSSRGYVATATLGGIDLLHKPFVFVPGSSVPVEVTMRDDGAEIEGTVAGAAALSATMTTPAYAAASTAYVYCIPLPDSPGQFQQIWVSAEGKFHSQPMAPGAYRVLAFKTPVPNLPYRDAEAMRGYDTKGQIVNLVPRGKEKLQLQIMSGSE